MQAPVAERPLALLPVTEEHDVCMILFSWRGSRPPALCWRPLLWRRANIFEGCADDTARGAWYR